MARASYVWLRPIDGWDIPHRTFVDRIELRAGNESPPPAERRVRPAAGLQMDGPGFIQWEAEDALTPAPPPAVTFAPRDAAAQRLLSGGTWVIKGKQTDLDPLRYSVDVPAAGTYALWARGFWKAGSFRWRFDQAEWQTAAPDLDTGQQVMLQPTWLPVGWCHVADVALEQGLQAFEVEPVTAPQHLGFDCFVLARDAFVAASP